MMVIEAHESASASTHHFAATSFGSTVSGQQTYTTTLVQPEGESFAAPLTGDPIAATDVVVYVQGTRQPVTVDITVNGTTNEATLTFPAGDPITVNGLSIRAYFTVSVLINVNERHIFPADRCTWVQGYSEAGYYFIDGAVFYNGVSATGVALSNPRLGFIGKSGRFVEIAK